MINLVDVGASEGVHHRWVPHLNAISAILFEPAKQKAEELRFQYQDHGRVKVVEKALWNSQGVRMLHIAHHFGCTSMRKPYLPLLADYGIDQFFKVEATELVECERFDRLCQTGSVEPPDVIKVDVQGCEYEVLDGFGSYLEGVLAIEIEAHFYEVYRGQKLLGEMVSFLEQFDLVLAKIEPTPHFKGDVIEVDALFLPSRKRLESLAAPSQAKLAFIKNAYAI